VKISNPHLVGGRLVYPDKIIDGIITVRNGKIVKIQKNSSRALLTYDFRRKGVYILPGLIETHGHFREPGLTHKGDIPHETRAALAGGVTTTLDMPNTNPPTTTVKLLNQKIKKIYPKRAYTDYSFFLGVSKDSLNEINKVNKKKIVGLKVFMAGHETTPTTIPDDETLGKVFKIAARRDILVGVHAEDQDLINHFNKKFGKRTDAAVWSIVRPNKVVAVAVARAIKLAKKNKTRIYLMHLSTPEEFAHVDRAKKQGVKVFGELVSRQLDFSTKDYKKFGNKIKVAPALRDLSDQKKMWERLRRGKIDTICAEHTPHEWKTKNQPNVWKAQSGMPSIQENLPSLITSFMKKYGTKRAEEALMLLAKFGAKKPAEIFGLKTKGSIEKGKDADFTVVDLSKEWRVAKKDLFSKCGWSAYEGMRLRGRPIATFLRGNLVYENGKIKGKPTGRHLNS